MVKKDKWAIKIETIFLVYIAIMICVYNNCFLKWDSYNHPAISVIFKLMYHTASSLLLFYAVIVKHNKKKLTLPWFLTILMAVVLYLHANFFGAENILLNAIPMLETVIAIMAIFMMDEKKKNLLFEKIIIIFSILVLPSMIYFVLYTIGVKLPYTILASDHPTKVLRNISYMHYPFGLIIKAPWSIARYTGVFDEPGVVGTMAALLFAAAYRRCDKKWLILLFIEGMLSLSMAFYALLVIFVITRAFADGAFKAAGVIAVLIMAFAIFISYPFENENLKEIQGRIDITSPIFIKDNRTSSSFDLEFEKFIHEGGYSLVMGKGGTGAYEKNPLMLGSNSYKCLIYDLGIIGTLLYVGIFGLFAATRKWNKEYIPFIVVFMASIYQRAYVYNVQMVSIFLLGITCISSTAPHKYRLLSGQLKKESKNRLIRLTN